MGTEILLIVKGLKLTKDLKLDKVILESDLKETVDICNQVKPYPMEFQRLLADILLLKDVSW